MAQQPHGHETAQHGFRVTRIYEAPDPADGTRILVDRLWPRGVSKQQAHVDEWAKDVTPSTELRRWLHADPEHRRTATSRFCWSDSRTEGHRELDIYGMFTVPNEITLTLAAKSQ
ncbi:DUF488 domain-containing protein [Nocardia aurantia]|nr:DUF488 family protein [Nocardia aurantia]